MRFETASEKDRAPGVVRAAPWRVKAITVLSEYRLGVEFMDGTAGTVDLRNLLGGSGVGVFAVLRDEAVFSQARVEDGVVTWPVGLDLAPDAMYDAIRASGEWKPE